MTAGKRACTLGLGQIPLDAVSPNEPARNEPHGSLAYYGTYTVNEAEKSVTMQMEGATFPNWIGTSPKRLYAISGDTLTVTNPTPSGGGGILTVVLKRAGQKAM
jgi:lipocalin-like protein